MSIGEGNDTPFQYSCLENPMDGGAWQAAVHVVAKSRTRLSEFTFTFHFHALQKEMATPSSILAWRIPGTGGVWWAAIYGGRTESDRTDATQQQQNTSISVLLVTDMDESCSLFRFTSVQSLSRVQLFVTPWTPGFPITNSWSLLKLMSIESVMPSNHLILCHPLVLLPSIFPSIRVLYVYKYVDTCIGSILSMYLKWDMRSYSPHYSLPYGQNLCI